MNHLHSLSVHQPGKRSQRSRSGSILIAVMVCMAVATTIMLGIVGASLHARRQMKHELQMEQTHWLLEAGVRHANRQYDADHDYNGEIIGIEPALSTHHAATLTITLLEESSDAKRFQVTARVQGMDPADKPTQRSESFAVAINTN